MKKERIQERLLDYEPPTFEVMEVVLEMGFVKGSSQHEGFESNDGGHESMEQGDDYGGGFI